MATWVGDTAETAAFLDEVETLAGMPLQPYRCGDFRQRAVVGAAPAAAEADGGGKRLLFLFPNDATVVVPRPAEGRTAGGGDVLDFLILVVETDVDRVTTLGRVSQSPGPRSAWCTVSVSGSKS
jgi:hypothetical protein